MILRRAAAQIAVAALIPTALFAVVSGTAGLRWAIGASITYYYGMAYAQHRRRGRASGMLSVACVLATIRAAGAMVANSGHFYFGLPVFETAAIGCLFLATCATRTPLVSRFAADLVPDLELDAGLVLRLSVVWMVVHLGIALTTLWMLTHEPLSVFVWMKVINGWSWMTAGAVASLLLTRTVRTAHRSAGWSGLSAMPLPAS